MPAALVSSDALIIRKRWPSADTSYGKMMPERLVSKSALTEATSKLAPWPFTTRGHQRLIGGQVEDLLAGITLWLAFVSFALVLDGES